MLIRGDTSAANLSESWFANTTFGGPDDLAPEAEITAH